MGRASLAGLSLMSLVALGGQALPPRAAVAATDPYAGVEVLRGLFASYDFNRDGWISARELNVFTELTFVSMDTDESDRISREEFMTWDPGFASLARERGKVQAFDAAKNGVFESRDRGRDGSLDATEVSVNGAHDFVIADKDRDGSLSPGEFALGFPILAALARALR